MDPRAAADMMGPDRQKSSKSSRASSRTRAADVDGGVGGGSEREPAANEEIAMQTLRDPDDARRTKSAASRRSAHSGHVAIAMPPEGAADASAPPANADPVAVIVDGEEDGGALSSHTHTHAMAHTHQQQCASSHCHCPTATAH